MGKLKFKNPKRFVLVCEEETFNQFSVICNVMCSDPSNILRKMVEDFVGKNIAVVQENEKTQSKITF